MPQNGIHAMAGIAVHKWMPKSEWLLLGLVLGNMFPDLDQFIVAFATLAKIPDPTSFHRTFTHSIFTVISVIILFYVIASVTKNANWKNFGVGFGIGILMHILLDLVFWFNGVELFWPIRYELNFWSWFVMPVGLKIILDTGEFLAFGLYFLLLGSLARKYNTDRANWSLPRLWAYVEFALFILFTLLFFSTGLEGLPYTIFGALYLVSIVVAMVITIRMKQTIESLSS